MRNVGKFYDDKNFPRGFNRSGVFTLSEANILESYGRTMRGIQEGLLQPENPEEIQFFAEITGQQEVASEFAKCWMKYLKQTSTKVRSYTLCNSPRKSSASSFEDDSDDSGGSDEDMDY
ncbi:DUF413 domain-containing protein [Photobacterium galatheae]|uniref:Macrodomain Ori protein n=1 Tax=Photobacterium galatheae TaxID=1654360 RepID=A0A066RKD2_9GAMM|nr:DUF413 domain-containing protein [Photobacterium galatheae]KDM90784.1 hypothetical protein EA58_15470 [Photobacterium galatheae]MCM0149887.1 DUF413 domain-containing protein [Photobacterium galatheae]